MLPATYVDAVSRHPALDHAAQVHLVASMLAHQREGPLSGRLMATPPDALMKRRAMLRASWAWSAAESLLAPC